MTSLTFIDSLYATQNFAKNIRKEFNDKNNKLLTDDLEKIINTYRSAKQSHMLGKKHEKSKVIIRNLILIINECHENSKSLLEHFLGQVLFESETTSDESKLVNISSPYILLSDALLYIQRNQLDQAFFKLNMFFKNNLLKQNLQSYWDFYTKHIVVYAKLEGLENQLSNLDSLDSQTQESIRSSIHKLLEKINLDEEFDVFENLKLDVNLLIKNIEIKLSQSSNPIKLDYTDDFESVFANLHDKDEEHVEKILSEIFQKYIRIEEFLTTKYGDQLKNIKAQYYLKKINPETKDWNNLLINHVKSYLYNDNYEKAVNFIKELIDSGKNKGDSIATIIKGLYEEFNKSNRKFDQFIAFMLAFKDIEFELNHRIQYFYSTISIIKSKSNRLFNLPDYIDFCDEITAAFVKLVQTSSKGKVKKEWRKSAYVDRGLFMMYNFKKKENCLKAIEYFNLAFKEGFNEIRYYENIVFCYVKAGEIKKCRKFLKNHKNKIGNKISENILSTQMIKRIQNLQNFEGDMDSLFIYTPSKIKCIEKVKEFVKATETIIDPTEDLLSLRALNTILQDDCEDLNKVIYEYMQPQVKINTLISDIYLARIKDCLKYDIENDKDILRRVLLLIYLAPDAAKVLVDYLEKDHGVKYMFTNITEKYLSINFKNQSQIFNELNEHLDYLNIEFDAFIRSEFTRSSVSEKIPNFDGPFIHKRDNSYINEYRRLKGRINILKDIPDYTERIDKLRKYQEQLEDRKKEIISQPTIMQTYIYNEYVNNLIPLIQKIEIESNKTLAPKIELSVNALAYDIENVNSTTISVTMINKKNRADATEVELSLSSPKNLIKEEKYFIGSLTTDPLGHSKEIKLDNYKENFIKVKVNYKFNGKTQSSISKKCKIMVIKDKFKEINNPYIVGRVVEESNMFYGRTDLVNELYRRLIDKQVSVAMYGQKRVGKTSTFYHLEQKLKENKYCVISFSFSNKMDEFRFYKELAQKIVTSVVEDLPEDLEDMAYNIPPGDILFASNLLEKIITYLKDNKLRSYKGIILKIDEFTNLYASLKDKDIESSLLGTFKYLIESNLIRVAVIGQDTFLEFYSAYSNELSVLDRIKIDYLSKPATLELIVKPILLENGGSRYKENSEILLYNITKGQPWYTQRFCSLIVEYLNRQKQLLITRGTINVVKRELINEMTEPDFHNLLLGGVGTQLDTEDVRRVLEIIAKTSRHGEYCHVDELNEIPNAKSILMNLKDRNVLEVKSGIYYKIYVPLFNDWLLQNCKY